MNTALAATPAPAAQKQAEQSTGVKPPTEAKPLRMNLSEETLVLTDDISVAKAQADKYPDNPEAWFLLATAYSRTPYFEKAFAAARQAKKLIKQSPEGYAGFDRRIQEYEGMQASDPQNPKILYRLGFAYFMKGYILEKNYIKDTPEQSSVYYAKAEQALRQVIALDPGDVWARNYLGYVLVAQDQANTNQAIQLWEEAIALRPVDNPGAYFMLGEAYLKKGNLKKAIQYGNKGLAARKPQEPDDKPTTDAKPVVNSKPVAD